MADSKGSFIFFIKLPTGAGICMALKGKQVKIFFKVLNNDMWKEIRKY